MRTNQKLSLKLENFEERMSLESEKYKILKHENEILRVAMENLKKEKADLQKLLDKNYVIMSTISFNF
jgi:hypothetical protein